MLVLLLVEVKYSLLLFIGEIEALYGRHAVDKGYLAKAAVIHWLEYRPGTAVVLDYETDDTPVFGIIRHIIVVIQHDLYFVIEDTEANCGPHTLYYLLTCQNTVTLKSFRSLKCPWPLSVCVSLQWSYCSVKCVLAHLSSD